MKNVMKRFCAVLLSITMLIGIVPAGQAEWYYGPWLDPVTNLTLEKAKTGEAVDSGNNSITLYPGEKRDVTINNMVSLDTITPDNIASVSQNGTKLTITAQNVGYTTILYKKNDGGIGYYVVNVLQPNIQLEKTTYNAVLGETKDTKIETLVQTRDRNETISWSSSDPAVVTVSSNGTLHFTGVGSTTVKASINVYYKKQDGTNESTPRTFTRDIQVNVSGMLDSVIMKDDSYELFTGEHRTMELLGWEPEDFKKVDGSALTAADFTWRSSNNNVVSLQKVSDSKYTLHGERAGSAVIYITYGSVAAEVKVLVSDTRFDITPDNVEMIVGQNMVLNSHIIPAENGKNVSIKVKDPTVVRALWLNDKDCVLTGLKEGSTSVTLTMEYEIEGVKDTIEQTVDVLVRVPEDPTQPKYTVTFVDYDGTILSTKTVESGFEVTAPDFTPEHDGLNFEYFRNTETGATCKAKGKFAVTANTVMEAIYSAGECTVKFVDSDFTASHTDMPKLPSALKVTYGKTASKPASYGAKEYIIKENGENRYYRFIGWKDKENNEMFNFSTKITESVTLEPVWEMVECSIMRRTFRGIYGDDIVVPKGSTNVEVKGLTQFTQKDHPDYYMYYFTNSNDVGKDVRFQFWQYQNDQIKSDTYIVKGPILNDVTITAVYEPGLEAVFSGNGSSSSYYHSTNVYVPCVWVDESNPNVELQSEMVLTDVYPLYGETLSPVYGLKYHNGDNDIYGQDKDNQLATKNGYQASPGYGGKYYANTAKYGRVNLEEYKGTEITVKDKTTGEDKIYEVVAVDYSKVETVWLCMCEGHTFNGYCAGGTWNALGQAILYVREKDMTKAKVKVNYYVLPEGFEGTPEKKDYILKTSELVELELDDVLYSKNYTEGFGDYYTFKDSEWIGDVKDGTPVEPGENYEINLYFTNDTYTLTIHYIDEETGKPLFDDYVETGLQNNEAYYRQSPDADGYTCTRTVVDGTIAGENAEEFVYYQRAATLYYVALEGGAVTTASEKVGVVKGEALGSYAIADDEYTLVGWYADEECTEELGTDISFIPTKDEGEEWVDGTTFYAKFQCVKPIVITSGSHTWTYDGEAHTEETYTVTYDGKNISAEAGSNGKRFTLPTGDEITISSPASVKNTADTGSENNTFEYTLTNEGMYSNVSVSYGDLTVLPAPIVITVPDNSKEYGTEDPEFAAGKLPDDLSKNFKDELKDIDTKAYRTNDDENVGGYEGVLTTELSAEDYGKEYPNFTFTVVPGDFEITPPKAIVITSGNHTWTYDGEAHTEKTYTVTYGGEEVKADADGVTFKLPTGDKLVVKPDATASVTDVADTDTENNTFTYELENEDQYDDVTSVYGDLTVTPAPIVITVPDNSKEYGTEDPKFAAGKLPDDLSDNFKKELEDIDTEVYRTNDDEEVGGYSDVLTTRKTVDDYEKQYPNFTFEVIPADFTITGPSVLCDKQVEEITPSDAGKALVGSKVAFTITVKNVTNSVADRITVDDDTAVITEGSGYTVEGNTAVILDLAVNGTVIVNAEHIVTEDDLLAGEYVNTAKVTFGDKEYYPSAEVETVDIDAALTVQKFSDMQGKLAQEGDFINYTLVVKNTGNVTLYNVVVNDNMTNFSRTLKSLAPGEEQKLHTQWKVTAEDVEAGKVFNIVTAKSDPVKDPDPSVPDHTPEDDDSVTDFTERTLHKVTVRYWYESVDGETAAPTVVNLYYTGETFNVISPRIGGWTADQETVSGTVETGDLVFDVIYTRNPYQLTIRYVDIRGREVAPTYQDTLFSGEHYEVNSPAVSGLTPDKRVVKGDMPASDLQITVVYVGGGITIVDYDTPLGLGIGCVNMGECYD